MTKQFTFSYFDDTDSGCEYPTQADVTASYNFDDNSTWDVVLEKFVAFLGLCWGYDISDRVQFKSLRDRIEALYEDGVLGDDDPWADEYDPVPVKTKG